METLVCVVRGVTYPNFPQVMEPESVGPNANHTPTVQEDNAKCNCIEHGLCVEFVSFLDGPEGENTNSLDQQLGQCMGASNGTSRT